MRGDVTGDSMDSAAGDSSLVSTKAELQDILRELRSNAIPRDDESTETKSDPGFDRCFNKFDRCFNKFDRCFNKFDRN
ncbi:MAG: hypothetical protein JWM95_233 [Gemmatimonadetes bacterium]|nr:hypothetical protein [Gemmatimonadota bacterium]